MKESFVILDEVAYGSGAYEVTINTSIGTFTGYTEPDEIDAQYPSIYHASEIALTKALRKFAEATVNLLKRDIKLLGGLMKQSVDMAKDRFDIDNTSFRLINGTLKQKQKDLVKWEGRVDYLSNKLIDRVQARDKIVANYLKKDKTE